MEEGASLSHDTRSNNNSKEIDLLVSQSQTANHVNGISRPFSAPLEKPFSGPTN